MYNVYAMKMAIDSMVQHAQNIVDVFYLLKKIYIHIYYEYGDEVSWQLELLFLYCEMAQSHFP